MMWLGIALVAAPLVAILGAMTVVLWQDFGWRGPATWWAMFVLIGAPLFTGAWLLANHG